MYHLTRYKYWFFAISGLVIVPGLLALIFWHLNLGIDFTNGATIDLRFAHNNVTTTQVAQAFKKAGAQDVEVYATTNAQAGAIPAKRYFYITFSRPIGSAEVESVRQLLGIGENNIDRVYYTVTTPGSNTQTAMMVVHFNSDTTVAKVEAALKKLPPTDAPPVQATPTPATQPTATAKGTATAKATTTTTPVATATAVAATTPSATTTPPANNQTFPVKVTNVSQGQNETTYEVNTQTFLQGSQLDAIVFELGHSFGPVFVQDQTNVGPAIASQTTINAFFAVLLASAAILAYIAIAFHKVGSAWRAVRFGSSAIIALLHDVLVVLGLWAIFGHFFNFKVDSLFLTAVLTVIGFSVHDTIVVFDRIRENLARRTSETFETVVNTSLIQTMSRSLNTSLTVLFTLSALTLFGGASIQEFTLALLIGIASGTYSSIFNASMILVVWETGEYKQWFDWFGRLFGRKPAEAPLLRGKQRSRALAGSRG